LVLSVASDVLCELINIKWKYIAGFGPLFFAFDKVKN